jgi:hypothetical protein
VQHCPPGNLPAPRVDAGKSVSYRRSTANRAACLSRAYALGTTCLRGARQSPPDVEASAVSGWCHYRIELGENAVLASRDGLETRPAAANHRRHQLLDALLAEALVDERELEAAE